MKHLHDSKLLQALRGLSDQELEHFGHYLANPMFNTRPQSNRLLDFLQTFAPAYRDPALNEKNLFRAVFGEASYHHQHVKTEFSHLFRLLKGFLAVLELKERREETDLLAMAQLRKRKREKVFLAQQRALKKRLDLDRAPRSSKLPTDVRLRLSFQLQDETERFFGQQQRRLDDTGIEEKMERLDTFFFYHKLRGGCEMLNRQNILDRKASLPLMAEVQGLSGSRPDEAAITLYRQIYLCLAEPEVLSHFQQLKKNLHQLQHDLPRGEARAMFKYAQNYCIARINRGEAAFYREIFGLYQVQLEKEIIFSNGALSHMDYSNIVTTALRLKEFAWAASFIESYQSHLLPEYQKGVYAYNLANLHFEQKKLRAAIRLLREVEIDDPFYEASSKVLLCKVYFESQEWEALRYLIEAFKRYLKRSRAFSQKHCTHYLHFLRHLKSLLLLYERRASLVPADFQARLRKVAVAISEDGMVSNKKWLEGKC
jgi:hypothetical protein